MAQFGQQYGQYGALEAERGPLGYSPPSMRDAMSGEGREVLLPPFASGKRRSLNITAIWTAIFGPWLLFVAVFFVLSMPLHFDWPALAYFVVVLCLAIVVSAGGVARYHQVQRASGFGGEPNWFGFLFVSLLFAWLCGVTLGVVNYMANMLPYQQMAHLNTYTDVHPASATGQSVMDAAIIKFDDAAKLDMTKIMSFKNDDTYCVAPVMAGDLKPGAEQAVYDFWAVGTNCCSGKPNDWRCDNGRNPRTHSAMRLMPSNERPYYRLAVQQAEAMFKIRSNHPLFFRWVDDPTAEMEAWKFAAYRDFRTGLFSYLVFQCFFVVVALIGFSKLGHM